MELTETQTGLLFEAYAISRAHPPMGAVLKPDAYPDAHELAEPAGSSAGSSAMS